MGYRSDVAAAIYTNDEEHVPLLKLWLTANFPMKQFEKSMRWFKYGVVIEEHDVKWYDSYDEVKLFNAAVSKFVEEFCGAKGAFDGAYEFLRIGESEDDIEHECHGDYDYLLSCERSICIDV